jgi:hypothetical protein
MEVSFSVVAGNFSFHQLPMVVWLNVFPFAVLGLFLHICGEQ